MYIQCTCNFLPFDLLHEINDFYFLSLTLFMHIYMLYIYIVGTYNNQYMVLDLKKVHLGMSIDDDALWVVEQIPRSAPILF